MMNRPPPLLDPAIRVETTARGTRYILPIRKLGKGRIAGLWIMAFGLLGSGFMVFWTLSASGLLERGWQFDAFHIFRLGFAVAGLIGLAFAAVPLLVGLMLVLPNHSEIRFTDRWMYSREISGPFRWTFRRERGLIRNLHLGNADIKVNDKRPTGPSRDWAGIIAKGDFKRPMIIACLYPRQMLIPLVQTLAAHCNLHDPVAVLQLASLPTSGIAPPAPVVQIDPAPSEPPEENPTTPVEEPIPPQPAKSTIVLLQDGPTATFAIPRAGWKSPFAGLGCFGVIWIAFVVVFTVAAAKGNMHDKHGGPTPWLRMLAFLSLFWAAGLGMLLGGLAGMVSKSVLLATPDFLLWSKSGLFGKKEKQWERNQIAALGVGDLGTEVNHNNQIATLGGSDSGTEVYNNKLHQLQIYLAGADGKIAKKTGLLTGRDPDELSWIAAITRQTMGIPRR
ncbi:MAG: hypothetical protein WCI73_08835 [Phycisphaerae bacterium]